MPQTLLRTALILISLGAMFPLKVSAKTWIEVRRAHYSIYYQKGYKADAKFTQKWMDRIEDLMRSKYDVVPTQYHISVYLLPLPTDDIDVNESGQNRCCVTTNRGRITGTIKLLTPSSPAWKNTKLKSSLGLLKNAPDYSVKVLLSEYIPIAHYCVQAARPAGGWEYYDAPNWFIQGLQEYDAIFHTTVYNRKWTAASLLSWAKSERKGFTCCKPIKLGDDYNGGAIFMAFLAERFGEDVHKRILQDSSPTFDGAILKETGHSLPELFDMFQSWLDRTAALDQRLMLDTIHGVAQHDIECGLIENLRIMHG